MKAQLNNVEKPFTAWSEKRPWGRFDVFADNEKTTTKLMRLNQSQRLSLQMHEHRDQLYVLLDDGFIVQYATRPVPEEIRHDREKVVAWTLYNLKTVRGNRDDIFLVKRYHLHRIQYAGRRPQGWFLDVAYGENDEEDIFRYIDDYGRGGKEG